jgi:hypothetical protein
VNRAISRANHAGRNRDGRNGHPDGSLELAHQNNPGLEDQVFGRVEWTEVRAEESYWVIADFTNNGWEFWEKNAWEIRWYRMATTPQCLDKAERAIHACGQAA